MVRKHLMKEWTAEEFPFGRARDAVARMAELYGHPVEIIYRGDLDVYQMYGTFEAATDLEK